MLLKEMILLSLILMFVIGWLIFVALVISYERTNRIKKLKKNLSYFNPKKLSDRLDAFNSSEEEDENDAIFQLTKQVNDLQKRDYNKINVIIDQLNKLTAPSKVLSFGEFSRNFKTVINIMKNYENKYLEVRFALFDLTSDIEIEKAILNQLKDKVSLASSKITNSPNEKINSSKKLNNKVNSLRRNLSKLEEMISSEKKHLNNDFIELEEKIDSDITSLTNDVDFMNHTYKHIEEDLNGPLAMIVDSFKKNSKVLEELKPEIVKYSNAIKNLKRTILEETDDLKIKKASENTLTLDKLISELNLLIRSNIDYAKFNFEHDRIPSLLLEHIKENHSLYISEVKRHRLSNEQKRLLLIESAYESFEDTIKKYEWEKMNKVVKHSPSGVHKLLMDTANAYEYYVKVVTDNIQDISVVNSSTNEINKQIAQMNTHLLQIEHNIKPMGGVRRDEFENEKNEIQRKVALLRENFKNNVKVVDEKSFLITRKVMDEVIDLTLRTKGAAFEHYFLKETIMYLNRFKGSNPKFDILLDAVKDSFNDEKYVEALRRAKELVEIYGIK